MRFSTVGDLTLTGCVESTASTIDEIIDEIAVARVTERGATPGDDRFFRSSHGRPKKGRLHLMDLLRFATAGSVDDGKVPAPGPAPGARGQQIDLVDYD